MVVQEHRPAVGLAEQLLHGLAVRWRKLTENRCGVGVVPGLHDGHAERGPEVEVAVEVIGRGHQRVLGGQLAPSRPVAVIVARGNRHATANEGLL